MDTEFPGVVARPIADNYSTGYAYQTLRCNVDLLKIIQLGVSFCSEEGVFPSECHCFQFNFKFSLTADMYAQDSIDLLKESGIDFARHEDEGIDVHRFGELIMTSGLVLVPDVRWVSFHSGYDFGYLVKLLTCEALPSDEESFFELLRLYFPNVYDVKLMMSGVDGLHGGLQKVAEDLKVERIGPMHQAGSDSLLTASTFFALSEKSLSGVKVVEDKFRGELYGYGQHSYRPPPRGSSGAPSNGIGGGNTVQSHAGMSFHVNGIVNGPGSLALGGVDEGDDDCPPGVADDLGI